MPPYIAGAVFAQAFVVETIDGCYLARLVITPDKGDAIGVADLKAEEEEEGFEAVETAVDKVAWRGSAKRGVDSR
jgi:hypothetical protein